MEKYMTVVLQITAICNAILLGWSVKVDGKKIILTKKIEKLTKLDNDIQKLINTLLDLEEGNNYYHDFNELKLN
jgi:hypothetical protein